MAEAIGVGRQTISRIENSQHKPAIDVAPRIADGPGVCAEDMFSLEPGIDGNTKNRERLIDSMGVDDDSDPQSASLQSEAL